MISSSVAFGSFCVMIGLIYFFRLNDLQYKLHAFSFMALNSLFAAVSMYCGTSLFLDGFWDDGRSFLQIVPVLAAAAYLFRSQHTYEVAKTAQIAFDVIDPFVGDR